MQYNIMWPLSSLQIFQVLCYTTEFKSSLVHIHKILNVLITVLISGGCTHIIGIRYKEYIMC